MEKLIEWIALLVTIVIYMICKKIYQKKPRIWLSPILVVPILLVGMLLLFHIPYASYESGTQWLQQLLGPATVAFAIPMYKYANLLKKHRKVIILSVGFGSLLAIISTFLFAKGLGIHSEIITSLIPRSITTPIAIHVSQAIKGIPTMTAVFVIMTGMMGTVMGTWIIRLGRIRHPLAKGIMFGMGAHGTGTSKAFELGDVEGTFSSLAMIVAAGITIGWVYLFILIT
ncbi:LrgB family protein [Hazenella coriacea]|uniref:Putative murein hydrolase (TIGR00659 family) n=1 Tax=Hazenella coriacea TaxID=1179467 RepID=A0A4R3L3K3_9BACL|nr:LrgB family protein [Hazenella coriacea]TCS93495.1 putative murein hydrolase (TIGR00659 family) [Hazenella coriacea]